MIFEVLEKAKDGIESKWPKTQDAMIDAMIRLERALAPRIAELSV